MSPWLGLIILGTRVTCHQLSRARSHFQHQMPGEGSMMAVTREFSGTYKSSGSELRQKRNCEKMNISKERLVADLSFLIVTLNHLKCSPESPRSQRRHDIQ